MFERLLEGQRVIRKSEIPGIVYNQYKEAKGIGARPMSTVLKNKQKGVSVRGIQKVLIKDNLHQKMNVRFTNKAPLKPIVLKRPMGRIQLDLIDLSKSSFLMSTRSRPKPQYILSVLDVYSRFTWLRPVRNKSSDEVLKQLKSVFDNYGYPLITQTDQGKEFEGSVRRFLLERGIKFIQSSPFHPQSQGKVERMHRTLRRMIGFDIATTGVSNWVKNAGIYQRNLNDRPREALGWFTPFEAFFGRPRMYSSGKQKFLPAFTHKKVLAATKRCNSNAVRLSCQKFKTPIYKLKDHVYIRQKKSSSRVTGSYCLANGIIVGRNLKKFRYKVQYDDKEKWFSVRNIVSSTMNNQAKREGRTAMELQKGFKTSKFAIASSHKSNIVHLRDDFGLPLSFDPVGDGDCQFAAIADQLQLINITGNISASVLRAQAVSYLANTPCLGNQNTTTWFASLVQETRGSYLDRMAERGSYGDQITLQAISEHYNVQILILSTLNRGTTLIDPQGSDVLRTDRPFLVLGHFAETGSEGELSEHYVSLHHDADIIQQIVSESQQVYLDETNDNLLDSPPQVDETRGNGCNGTDNANLASSVSRIHQESIAFNCYDVVYRVIKYAMIGSDPTVLQKLACVNRLFNSLVTKLKPLHVLSFGEKYIAALAKLEQSKIISVRRLVRAVKRVLPDVVADLKEMINSSSWINYWLELDDCDDGITFEVVRFFTRK